MGQSQLTIADALSEGADPLLLFPPETGLAPRSSRSSPPRSSVERRIDRIPYSLFVLGFAVGAFAGGMTGRTPESAAVHEVAAPTTSMSGRDVQLESASAIGTAGIEQPRAVDASSVVSESPRRRPESQRSRPESGRSRQESTRVLTAASGVRPARHLGTLRVDSTPSGAEVFLNSSLAGQTPLVIRNLPVGSRAVRISLDGYTVWSRGVRIVADQATAISARLDPKQ
jgi:hypothetical protein